MPQFSKQSSRPLTPAGYIARTDRIIELAWLVRKYSNAGDVRGKQQLTRAIHGLAHAAKNLSQRHRETK